MECLCLKTITILRFLMKNVAFNWVLLVYHYLFLVIEAKLQKKLYTLTTLGL